MLRRPPAGDKMWDIFDINMDKIFESIFLTEDVLTELSTIVHLYSVWQERFIVIKATQD